MYNDALRWSTFIVYIIMFYSLKNYLLLNIFNTATLYSEVNFKTFYNLKPVLNFLESASEFLLLFKTFIFSSFYSYLFESNFFSFKSLFSNNSYFYSRFKFLTFVGVGFKKRMRWVKKHVYLFFGHRHWIIFEVPKNFSIYLIKRKSVIMYADVKHKINTFLTSFKNFKKESMFKLKGLFDMRSRKRWLFMRRVKIKGVRPKLSKKQKLL